MTARPRRPTGVVGHLTQVVRVVGMNRFAVALGPRDPGILPGAVAEEGDAGDRDDRALQSSSLLGCESDALASRTHE